MSAGSESFQAHFSDLSEYSRDVFGLQCFCRVLAPVFQDARESTGAEELSSWPAAQSTGTILEV